MMNHKKFSEHGQALVIIAIAIVGLVGIVGLAIDGGMAFSDRRHAQNTADAAAFAGALGKVRPTVIDEATGEVSSYLTMQQQARARADSNGYYGDLIHSQVEVYTCDEPDASCEGTFERPKSNYVQVIITSYVNTYFARVVGIPQVTNRVQAVVLAIEDNTGPLFDARGIMATDNNCEDDPQPSMIIQGDANITLIGGGFWSNANTDCMLKCGGSTSLTLVGGEFTTPSDGFAPPPHVDGECLDALEENSSFNADPFLLPDDIPTFDRPIECDNTKTENLREFTPMILNHDGADHDADRLYPGYYDEFPPKQYRNSNTQTKDHLFMTPGVYCVDSVLKQVDQNVYLIGDDILIYVLPYKDVKINGGKVQITRLLGNHTYIPWGETHEEFSNYLIVVEPPAGEDGEDYDYSDAPTCNVDIEGNSYNQYEGAIFAPSCDVVVTGNSGTPPDGIDSQIIGFHVTLIGNADFTIKYDPDKNPVQIKPPELGLDK